MKVAILGCGPSGLLATHAAVLLGLDPVVYSIPIQSDTPGTMYLHRPIPNLTGETPDATLTYIKRGDRSGYASKVYRDPRADCSWDRFAEGPVPAWNLRDCYEVLWALYNGLIQSQLIGPLEVPDIIKEYPRVISTIPARALCRKPYHKFQYATVWIGAGAAAGVEPGQIIYNGDLTDAWYRSSDVFGYQVTEFGRMMDGLNSGIKPTVTDCDCWNERILKVGRFGAWSKGELVHNAFENTYNYLEGSLAVHGV